MATKKITPFVALELKTFVPAHDFEQSKRFYRAIGFQEDWSNAEVACFKSGSCSFMLRADAHTAPAESLHMQVLVESADDAFAFVRPTLVSFNLPAEPPVDRPWGARDFVFSDPSGVRWRYTQQAS